MELTSTTGLVSQGILSTELPQSALASTPLTTGPITAAASAPVPTLEIKTGVNTYATIAPKAVSPTLTVTSADINTPPLDGARVTIGNGFNKDQDVLGIAGQTGSSGTLTITGTTLNWSYDSKTGVLGLTGNGSIAVYQAALRQVTYANTSQNPSAADRQIDFSLGNNLINTANNHFYQFVENAGVTWTDALAKAAGSSYFGLQGYLATVTSATEQAFVQSKVQGNGWIGASDAETFANSNSPLSNPVVWTWVAGPEAGTAFWNGLSAVSGGSVVTGQYANWDTKLIAPDGDDEPNNTGGTERYAHIIGNSAVGGDAALGRWNDLANDSSNAGAFTPNGYIVEYGGLDGDPIIKISASVTVYVPGNNNLRQLDFTGDGKADILWRDQATGTDVIWGMDGATRISQTEIVKVPLNWRVEAIADLDGNKKGDIIWRDYETGTVAFWQMNNTAILNQAVFTGVPLSWKIVGTGDFNGDGRDDVLWRDFASGQNAVWSMSGVNRIGQYSLTTVPVDWRVSAVGDFNGDGRADILWRQEALGTNAIWSLNGAGAIVQQSFVPEVPTGWFTPGTGLFDSGNTRADLLWRNVTGNDSVTYDWLMNGATIVQQGQLLGNVPADWRVVGLGDFNNDGRTDLLWRSYSSGQNAMWFVNGITVPVQGTVPEVALLNWEVVG